MTRLIHMVMMMMVMIAAAMDDYGYLDDDYVYVPRPAPPAIGPPVRR